MIINYLRNLFLSLKGKARLATADYTLPSSTSEMGAYSANFEKALNFTRSLGVPLSDITWKDGDVLDKEGSFIEPAMRAAGVRDVSKSAAQCLKWCHHLESAFEKQLGCKVWVTVGQIWKGETVVFGPDWGDLARWYKSGIQLSDFENRQGLNLHAWLTTETGEIIDPTFLSSLATFGSESYAKFAGAVVWGRDPSVLNDHRYYPMAIGRAFVESVARHSVVPLLASDIADLHTISFALVATPR